VVVVPKLFHDEISFCGIFDGTVGPYASDFLMNNITAVLSETHELQQLLSISRNGVEISKKGGISLQEVAVIIRDGLRKTFLETDARLLEYCDQNAWHYASSTGVAALLWRNMLTIAHVGDSKACIAKLSNQNKLSVEWLTVDHKPNMPHELRRIQESGGSLVYLHGNKAYIRGGDFLVRQARGEHPKQLNYSRAFGGKDLKKYGLIADPDVNHFEIQSDDKVVLIGSDGLWDALDPLRACEIAIQAKRSGRSATRELVQQAIRDMPSKNVCDNVSVIALFF
jgi:serine/threonine protein phosphatase PrpC